MGDASLINSNRKSLTEPGTQQTLHPQGSRERDSQSFWKGLDLLVLGNWGRVGQRHSQESGRFRREEEKFCMFVATCSFDKICDLVGPLGSWLNERERGLLGLQIWHNGG